MSRTAIPQPLNKEPQQPGAARTLANTDRHLNCTYTRLFRPSLLLEAAVDEGMDNSVVGRNDGYLFTRQHSRQLTQSSAGTAAETAQGSTDERDRRMQKGR